MRRTLVILGLLLIVGGAALAALPVSASVPSAPEVACNAAAVREYNAEGTSYAPAFDVWLHPSVVESPSVGAGVPTEYAPLCKTAAEHRLIWSGVLVVLGLISLILSAVVQSGRHGWHRSRPSV